MTTAFITALKRNPQQSFMQLFKSIRDELAGEHDQKPQLSCSHPLSKFSLCPPNPTPTETALELFGCSFRGLWTLRADCVV
jgi:hypothetical protein